MSKLKLIVRVSTNNYMHNNKLIACKTATLLKRKSNGSLTDLVHDAELDVVDMDLALKEDGLYELRPVNYQYDIESGVIDGYDLDLVPYKEGV